MATIYATVEELAVLTRQQIAPDDAAALLVLRMASSTVRAYVGSAITEQWGDSIPQGAVDVTLDVASRVWTNPEGLVADAIDDGRRQWDPSRAEGFYLTGSNKAVLDELGGAATAARGLFTISTTRGDVDTDTVYVPTGPPPSGYPFPWYDRSDPLVWGEQ